MNISKVVTLLLMPSLFLVFMSGADGALSTNPIVPASVNICDSDAFLVYINNTGTISENNILLNVTIPSGFSYGGNSSIIFPGGSSNAEPTVSGHHLEWNLTEIMTNGTGVVINELLPNPVGSDSGNERVELYNAGPATVNVSGWYINDMAGNKRYITSYIVSGNVSMVPGSFLVVGITGTILNNDGDTVFLLSEANLQKASVIYGASVEGQSWASMPDASEGWSWKTPSLGTTNGDLASGSSIRVGFSLTSACGTSSGNRVVADVTYLGGLDSRSSSSISIYKGFLNVTKNPALVEAGVGDVVNWTIAIKNAGLGPAYNVEVTDTLSSGLNLLSIDSPSGGVSWTYGVIDPGEEKTVNVSVNVTACEDLYDEVNASWGCDGTPCQEAHAHSSVKFVPRDPNLNYTISQMVVPYCGNVSVSVNVSNSGLEGIADLDLQFSGISADYAVSDVSGVIYHSGNETFCLGRIPSKSWKNFTFSFGVAYGDCCTKGSDGTITIYPHYRDDCENSWYIPSKSVSYSMDLATIPSIKVSKTANVFSASSGARVNFTILVSNTGNVTLDPVIVTDLLPRGLDELLPSSCGSVSENVVAWNLGKLNKSDSRMIWLTARINGSAFGNLTNVARVEGKPEFGENVTDDDSVNVTALGAKIEVEKSVDVPVAKIGANVTFTIVVNNTGSADLDPVILTDTLPSGLNYVSSTHNGSESGGIITWSLGGLNSSDSRSIELAAQITGSTFENMTNFVEVEGKPGHGGNVTDSDTEIVKTFIASLDVNKTANVTATEPFKNVNYTIVVTNIGNIKLVPVIVNDILPAGIDYVSAHPAPESITSPAPQPGVSQVVVWNLTEGLDPGESATIFLTGFVNGNYLNTTNKVAVLGFAPDGSATNLIEDNETTEIYRLEVNKTASKNVVKRGEEVAYTISVCNTGTVQLTDVMVRDVFDRAVEPVSISYAWSGVQDPHIERISEGEWLIGFLPNGACIEITLVVKVPKQEFEFEMDQGVSGEGFVNVANDYSTTLHEYDISNRVEASTVETEDQDRETVTVQGEPGTELFTREHGSGGYESEELVSMRTENKSISMEKDVSAAYRPTTLGLYNNRTMNYSSRWTEEAWAKNRITGASMSESYRYATSIDRESSLDVDKNGSTMIIDSEFEGMGHVGFLKKDPGSKPGTTPTFEASEDYVGSFKVLEKVDEYGSGVSSEKAASGAGLVAVDKRIGESQRSYESGTGAYDSEELIQTHTNYIAKEMRLDYAPASMNLSETNGIWINQSMLWKEGVRSESRGISYIGQESSSISHLDGEAVARGLNEMGTKANFSGRARFRAVLKDEVDIDEQYEGEYSLQRRVLFSGVPRYDRPHLNVVTNGAIHEETIFDEKEVTLAGESWERVITVATYTITLENDGNKALGPIYVRDLFPPEAVYIDASVRPSELTETRANWTLTHLAIGDVSVITLNLDVTKHHPAELVNRVLATASYDGDEHITASNFSALEMEWLTCCPNETLSVSKNVELDEDNPNVVWYSIAIKNEADVTRVATVTDSLPSGMVLIELAVPFASYENDTIVWNLVEIRPFETVTIGYRAEAGRAGRFVNNVEVDPRSVDGQIVQPVRAACVIEVGEVEECGQTSCSLWSPPSWDFESSDQTAELSCDELTCDEK